MVGLVDEEEDLADEKEDLADEDEEEMIIKKRWWR